LGLKFYSESLNCRYWKRIKHNVINGRLHYNGKKKYVSFFDTDKEEKVEIENNSQLYEYAARLIKVVEKYEKVTTTVNRSIEV
jgi:hypothetical protein